MVKPSALPIYNDATEATYVYQPPEPGVVESGFTAARHGLADAKDKVTEAVVPVYQRGRRFSEDVYSALLEEENSAARAGVIAGVGAFGLAGGALRGGRVKRILYAGLGAGAGAALCYPSQARVASDKAGRFGQCVRYHVRKSALVAYNYVAGREGGAQFDANLVANSIMRVSSYLQRKSKQLFHSIVYQTTPPTGLAATAVKPELEKEEDESKDDSRKEILDDQPEESEIILDIPNNETKETISSRISDPSSVPEGGDDPSSVREGGETNPSIDVSIEPIDSSTRSSFEVSTNSQSQESATSVSQTKLSDVPPTSEFTEPPSSEDDSESLVKPSDEPTLKPVIAAKKVLELFPVRSNKETTKGRVELIFTEASESSEETVEGDPGQSNPEDSDMYTTRG